MASLEMKFTGYNDALQCMTVNGKYVKVKRQKGYSTCSAECEGDKAEVIIYRTHHYVGKGWFIWNLLYFIVSIFGIFDVRQNKKFLVADCRFNVDIKENKSLSLKILPFASGKLLEFENPEGIEEIQNLHFRDNEAKKKHKIMNWCKVAVFAVAVIACVLAVVVF